MFQALEIIFFTKDGYEIGNYRKQCSFTDTH